jgi:O-antigen/teichoic acid export membrane protein
MFRKLSWLVFAVGSSQAAQLIMQPVLAKYYEPHEFNLLGQIISLGSLLVILANAQIHTCILVCGQTSDRQALFYAGFVAVTIFTALIVTFGGLLYMAGRPPMASMLCVYTGLMVWFLGTSNLLLSYFAAEGDFRRHGFFSLTRGISIPIFQLLFAVILMPTGLVIGILAGETVARVVGKDIFLSPQHKTTRTRALSALAKYRKVITFGTLQEMVAVAALMLPLYYFTTFFGEDVGGNYALAFRIAWAPSILIAGSLSAVLLRDLADRTEDQLLKWDVKSAIEPIVIFLATCSAYYLLIIPAFAWWLDDRWAVAVGMLSWISLWVSSYLAALKIRQIYRVLHLQKWQLAVDLFVAVCILIAYIIGKDNWTTFLRLTCLIGVIQNFLLVAIFFSLCRSHRPSQETARP